MHSALGGEGRSGGASSTDRYKLSAGGGRGDIGGHASLTLTVLLLPCRERCSVCYSTNATRK